MHQRNIWKHASAVGLYHSRCVLSSSLPYYTSHTKERCLYVQLTLIVLITVLVIAFFTENRD